ATKFGAASLWRGFEPALAGTGQTAEQPYDLTRLDAVNETLKYIRKKYVKPERVKPKQMLLSALNYVQRDIPQVIVQQENKDEVTVRVEADAKTFRIDNVQGPWDVAARLREVFAFLQVHLEGSDVDLRALEYAACNGMLHTLDPHSSFLSPDAYRDMNVQTSGAFGGLGIVISTRDQQLTVMRPMPNTPAERAGLKRFDRIVKIENESTQNMTLDDAVKRLRGEPKTSITIWIVREGDDGWTEPKPFTLEREIIKVTSVESRALDGDIGYIKLKNFQSSTAEETSAALESFRKKGDIKGLVLDLRGNPGGLLDQSVKVADLFIEDGVLVATEGASELREERRAVSAGTEPAYPMVVLVNGSSASASEILAGALKNLDRALIVGQQTFGKGSVQLVFPEITPEKAALKLTIAEYLTPGDISIQGVGITPDIELDPMTVDPLEMDLTVQKDTLKERELFASLESEYTAPAGKPEDVVRYQFTSAERDGLRELGSDADDDVRLDFPITFGRELVASMAFGKSRRDQLAAVAPLLTRVKKDELVKVSAELEKLGVVWAEPSGEAAAANDLVVTALTSRGDAVVTAGDSMDLVVTVKNQGKNPVYRLRAQTDSENSYFDAKELVFGKIMPGEERTARVPFGWCELEGRKYASTKPKPKDGKKTCKIPMDATDRSDGVTVKFEADGAAPAPVELRPTVRSLPRPSFKYSFQVVDDRAGNGDGRVQRGEGLSLYLTVKNVGTGPSHDTTAALLNMSGDGLLLKDGRFDMSNMAPGETRHVTFTFDVAKELADAEAVVSLSIADTDLNESVREKVKLPIEAEGSVGGDAASWVVGGNGAPLFEAPADSAREFGSVHGGMIVDALGAMGSYTKIKIAGGRYAFVKSTDLTERSSSKAPEAIAFDDVFTHAPPELKVDAPQLSTRSSSISLSGSAVSSSRIIDLYGFVGGRKIFYQSNKRAADPSTASFQIDVPLKPGVNVITIFARESNDSVTRRTLIIRRDGENGELLKTPKTEDAGDWVSGPSED
ncbi:MAG: MXAN_5808 family serine peptidase, partial [Polyangiaceae bacterium]